MNKLLRGISKLSYENICIQLLQILSRLISRLFFKQINLNHKTKNYYLAERFCTTGTEYIDI